MGAMELKVRVEGVVRVVCGLSVNTSCQDVVIALAQAIGQTGRYVLTLNFRGTERRLLAHDCPLQQLAQLGQLAAEVRFVLRRTGPSLSVGPDTATSERHFQLPGPSEPESLRHGRAHKALSFSLGPSTLPRRTKPNSAWSASSRASPEPRASPVSFLDPLYPVRRPPSPCSKEEVFRQILQQQRWLQELQVQLQALESETEVWSSGLSVTVVPAGEQEELEERRRQNEAELMHMEHWEEQFQEEADREGDLHTRLQQILSSMEDHSCQIQELQTRSVGLEQALRVQRRSSAMETLQPDQVLRPLKKELQQRLQQAEDLDSIVTETQRKLHAAEKQLQGGWEVMEELNKELRQCQLQHFIQQSAAATNVLSVTNGYLNNAAIMEREQPRFCTS